MIDKDTKEDGVKIREVLLCPKELARSHIKTYITKFNIKKLNVEI